MSIALRTLRRVRSETFVGRLRTLETVPIETCADKHESYHFANLTDLQLKYADVEPVQAVIDWLEAR